MNQQHERAIILKRLDFGEADRILTVLTPSGKKSMLAKGVRKQKSKLAGGLELFSTSYVTYIDGRSEIKTIVSTRLDKHYGQLASQYSRTMIGYDCTKLIHAYLEHEADEDYFLLLETTYSALDTAYLDERLVHAWFLMKLLDMRGNGIQLQHTARGSELISGSQYEFSFDDMAFFESNQGRFGTDTIKFLRLVRDVQKPEKLSLVQSWQDHIDATLWVLSQAHKYNQ